MSEYVWYPHPGPQEDFCSRWETEVLYGGAAGGGKSDCLIVEAARYVWHPEYKGLILRRTFPQLQEIIDRCWKYYPVFGGEYRATEHRWYFPSGATVKLGHMQHEDSKYDYQGQEYQFIAFDEASQFIPTQYLYLFSRCRSTVPGIPTRIRSATNPGGVGHQFLKDRFRIGLTSPGTTIYDDAVGISRVFIPAKLTDNPTLALQDPHYIARLYQLPEIEQKRLIYGDWDYFEGQFFSELNSDVHGFEFELPYEWECIASYDWGYARPWVYCLWRIDFDGRMYLDYLHYGAKEGDAPNMGTRQTDVEQARIISEIEQKYNGPRPRYRVAGHDIWSAKRKKDGMLGPAPAEEMAREGIVFIKADNNRIPGWQQIHHRLMLDEGGQPMVYFRRSLKDFWRTMLNLQADERNPEDLPKKDIEDHIPEAVRYGLMSRPMKPRHAQVVDIGSFQHERRRLIRARQISRRHGISLAAAYGRL